MSSSVAVFGQLDHLLRERNLTLADLKRQVDERYGLNVDELDRLLGRKSVHQMDMMVAAAAANVLDVELGDLFSVEDLVDEMDPSLEDRLLDEEPVRRIKALLDLQEERNLRDDERRELEARVEERGVVADAALDHFKRDSQRLIAFVKLARRRRASAVQ